MFTNANNNRQSNTANRLLNRIANSYIHSDSVNEAPTTPAPVIDDNAQSSTWVDSLIKLDHLLSGSLLRVCYTLIDMVLLSLGLYYGTRTCSISNGLAIISICILAFSGLALAFMLIFLVRNWPLRHMSFIDERSSGRYRQAYCVRGILFFLRLICICVGTGFVFKSKVPVNQDCEILRFALGIVCFNTWVLMFIWPPKPSLPIRRSLILECVALFLSITVKSIYIGTVLFAMLKTQASECMYTRMEDLYYRAPLESFAFVGLILIGSVMVCNILTSILNRLFYSLPNSRRVFVYLSAIHYLIIYLLTVIYIYYFSVGAVLIFQPRLGGACRMVAPNLYKTLFIWQIIQVFASLILWPLAILVFCLGVLFGTCLARCLPASISVPLLQMIQDSIPNIPNTPDAAPENPPASPDTIDALPLVVFGQASDEFNQTECAICQTDYEANEEVKKLPCDHIFHASCVETWLLTTRICPVCRRRITSAHL